MKKIGIIVGSLRKGSYNKIIAKYMQSQTPEGFTAEIIDISNLSLYNQDLEGPEAPAAWTEFRHKVKAVDAVLFLTPEYNRSYSGVIKNAIDIGSRPYTENVWTQKPSAVVSVSIGGIGGFGASSHLRLTMAVLNSYVMAQPEAYIGNVESLLDESKQNLVNESTQQFLAKFMKSFAAWINRF